MSINDEDILREIKKAQLFNEKGFLDYCRFDYHNKIKLDINKDFLEAAKKDGFIKPLLVEREEVQQENSPKNTISVDYYSPHQIYVIATLSKNQVHEGLLWGDLENLEFDQFQDLMRDAKKRKLSYKKQLLDLANKSAEVNIQIEVDELVEEIKKIIKTIDFADKFKVVGI